MNYIVPLFVSFSLITEIMTFILNPGIIYSDSKCKEKIYCEDCKFFYPKSNQQMEHCYTCNICVCKFDHHCDVIGKCIGKYNITFFFLFVLSTFSFIIGFSAVLFHLQNL